ncbi:MAG: thiolase family protein [Leptospira sp.]|jgi:acetyl-CoA acetyltransferase|nr:thiolase family protein [Leptospira sp.]
MRPVYIHSPNLSQFGRQNSSVLELSLNTVKKSLENFSYPIQFIIFTSFCPEIYTEEFHIPNRIAEGLGLKDIFCIRTETASSSGASAFQLATRLIESGKYDSGLVVGTEVMSKLSREKSNLLLGSVLSDEQRNLSMSMAQGGALVAARYLHEFGYTRKDLFTLSKKLHDNGLKNPYAHIKKNISWEDYESSAYLAEPLCIFDISPLSDGSASLIVSKHPSNTKVRGLGSGISPMNHSIQNLSFPSSEIAFRNAYKEAGITSKDISVAELHDAFTIFEIIGLECSGIAEKGKGLAMVVEGLTHPEGQIPINASGGLKSRGHPIGATGLAQIVELVWFMEKNPDKNIGLAHSIGGLATNNFVSIIEFIES